MLHYETESNVISAGLGQTRQVNLHQPAVLE